MATSKLMVDQADELYAVWDGKPARSYGGTADVPDTVIKDLADQQDSHVPARVTGA